MFLFSYVAMANPDLKQDIVQFRAFLRLAIAQVPCKAMPMERDLLSIATSRKVFLLAEKVLETVIT